MSAKHSVNVEIVTHTRDYYRSDEWSETDLPCAPAIMIDDDVIVEGENISEEDLESEIAQRL